MVCRSYCAERRGVKVAMNSVDVILVVFILLLLSYAIFDEFIVRHLRGRTLLSVVVSSRTKIDALIFTAFAIFALIKNIRDDGGQLTNNLLIALIGLTLWLFCIRRPRLSFKQHGIYLYGLWVPYQRVKAISPVEKSGLVLDLASRKIKVTLQRPGDVKEIIKVVGQVSAIVISG